MLVIFLACINKVPQVQEETPTVQRVYLPLTSLLSHLLVLRLQALTRLTPREYYDRSYRLKRACQASVLHAPLSKEQWTKSEDVGCFVMYSIHMANVLPIGCQIPRASC